MANFERPVLGWLAGWLVNRTILKNLRYRSGTKRVMKKETYDAELLFFNCKGELHEDDVHRHKLCNSDRAGT